MTSAKTVLNTVCLSESSPHSRDITLTALYGNCNLPTLKQSHILRPVKHHILATAATNGAVVLWNLNRPSRSKQEHVFVDHKRTVNKVCFHSTEPTKLISGSQDGTMRLFDLRTKEVTRTYHR
uniref:GATOR2 complex protein WDR24 n=1 Tax=Timema monikensis TaxID=170555 RepID=A0A7R9ELQ5_9NEOP|nr:unnamed protein product [Timema monikensis]